MYREMDIYKYIYISIYLYVYTYGGASPDLLCIFRRLCTLTCSTGLPIFIHLYNIHIYIYIYIYICIYMRLVRLCAWEVR